MLPFHLDDQRPDKNHVEEEGIYQRLSQGPKVRQSIEAEAVAEGRCQLRGQSGEGRGGL